MMVSYLVENPCIRQFFFSKNDSKYTLYSELRLILSPNRICPRFRDATGSSGDG